MIPVKGAGAPCLAHECSACCFETEMPLLEADIARLVARGFKREDFVERDGDYVTLRNVPATAPLEGHHCFFLKDGRCSVYEDRPEGCRWYPVTITPNRRVTKDDDCPHRGEFPLPPGAQRRLVALVNEMDREAKRRRHAA